MYTARTFEVVQNGPNGPQICLRELDRLAREVERQGHLTVETPLDLQDLPTGNHLRVVATTTQIATAQVLYEYADYILCNKFTFTDKVPQLFDQDAGQVHISAASWSGGVATFTTATAHGFSAGDTIIVLHVNPIGYNGSYTIASVPSTTTLTVALASNPGSYVGCGTIIDASQGFYVAKPYLLQQTPWDGEIVPFPDGSIHFYQYNVQGAVSATVAVGGSGYAVDDVLTVAGGTGYLDAQFLVLTLSGSGVATVQLISAGAFTTPPSNPVATSGGTGTGCTLNVTYAQLIGYRTDRLVAPMEDQNCNYLTDGTNYLFAWEGPVSVEVISPLYFTGDIIVIENGPTGTPDPNDNAITWTDANNGGRHWQDVTPGATLPFLAVLTAKKYGTGFIQYSWTQVSDSDQPTPITYTELTVSGGPGSFPAYHVNNEDIPDLTVVRMWRGNGNYYLFDVVPEWEFGQKVEDAIQFPGDANFYYPGMTVRWDEVNFDVVFKDSIYIIDFNTPN